MALLVPLTKITHSKTVPRNSPVSKTDVVCKLGLNLGGDPRKIQCKYCAKS